MGWGGSERLLHFLNAVLGADLHRPIVAVEIQSPYNEKEFLDDKLTVVDVKARDATGQLQTKIENLGANIGVTHVDGVDV